MAVAMASLSLTSHPVSVLRRRHEEGRLRRSLQQRFHRRAVGVRDAADGDSLLLVSRVPELRLISKF